MNKPARLALWALVVTACGHSDPAASPDAANNVDARGVDAPAPHIGPAQLYSAMGLGGLLSFAIDPESGKLVASTASSADPDGHLYAIAVSPSNTMAYTIDIDRAQLRAYRIEPDGALASIGEDALPTGKLPETIAIDPLGRFVYVGNVGQDSDPSLGVYRIDPQSGVVTQVPGSPFALAGAPAFVAPSPSGTFVYISQQTSVGIRAYRIDADSGKPTELALSPFGDADVFGGAIAISAGGGFLYNGGGNFNGFRVDSATGALEKLPGSPFATPVSSDPFAIDLALGPDGKTAFAITDRIANHISMFRVDPTSGAVATIGAPIASGPAPYSLAFDPSGRFVYVGSDEGLVSGFAVDARNATVEPTEGSPYEAPGLQPELAVVALP